MISCILLGYTNFKMTKEIEGKRYYKKMCDDKPCERYIMSMIEFRNDTVILIDDGYFTTYQLGTYQLDEKENRIECNFTKSVSYDGNVGNKFCYDIEKQINFEITEKTLSTENRFEELFGYDNKIENFILEEKAMQFYDLKNNSEYYKLSRLEYILDEIYKQPDITFQDCKK